MRIVHLSDLHFGSETGELQRDLMDHIRSEPADLIIVSGDFTQSGSIAEFKKAKAFLDGLGIQYLCVPGNHDIPRYDIFERFTNPYKRYKKYILKTLFPMICKDNVCIAGIATSRRALPHWNWANGAVSLAQINYIENFFWAHAHAVKICVMHHPIHKAVNAPLNTVVFGAERAMLAMADMKIDLVLTGHVHHASITTIEESGHRTIFLSASTALSTRIRLQKNGYNVITISDKTIDIDVYAYNKGVFKCVETLHESLREDGRVE
jgi:3',5'-cyclic AMP phosphodiesterase CpdA